MEGNAQGSIGLYSFETQVGLDVVQRNDTRRLYTLSADIAKFFNSKLYVQIAGEYGSGNDSNSDYIRVTGGNIFFKYCWPNRFRTANAFMGLGIGVTQIKRKNGEWSPLSTQPVWHLTFIGMEKYVFGKRMKGVCEIRWVLGDEKDSSSLRASVGIGVNIKKP